MNKDIAPKPARTRPYTPPAAELRIFDRHKRRIQEALGLIQEKLEKRALSQSQLMQELFDSSIRSVIGSLAYNMVEEEWEPALAEGDHVAFTLGGIAYRLYLTAGFIWVNGHAAIGTHDPEKRLILISDRGAHNQRMRTFWHEFGHAIENLTRVDLDALNSERFAECFEAGMGLIDTATLGRIETYLARSLNNEEKPWESRTNATDAPRLQLTADAV